MNFKEAIEQIRTLLADEKPTETIVEMAEVPAVPPAEAPAVEAPAEVAADPMVAMEARVMALEEKINAIIAKIEEGAQSESSVEDMAVQQQAFKSAIAKLTDVVDQLSQTPSDEPSNVQTFSLPKTKKDHLASIADNIKSIKEQFKK
jgi:hypothetical protein